MEEIICQRCQTSFKYKSLGGRKRKLCPTCIKEKLNKERICCICGGTYLTKERLSDKRYPLTTCSESCEQIQQENKKIKDQEYNKKWWRETYYPKNKAAIDKKNSDWAKNNKDRVNELVRLRKADKLVMETRICSHCEKEFQVNEKNTIKKYCQMKCMIAARNKRYYRKNKEI